MGMDVYGKKPVSDAGKYFRSSVWTWPPIWDLCCQLAPEVISPELRESGHYNDGAGLPARKARQLADILQANLASGEIAAMAAGLKASHDALPDEVCKLCVGTGRRKVPPLAGPGPWPCNGCGGNLHEDKPGTGKVRPFATYYPLRVDMVEEFARFLQDSGGFEIH